MELKDRVARLTARQRECLWLIRQGLEVKEVALRLKLSPDTVEYHLTNARRTIGTNRSSTAARVLAEHANPPPGWTVGGPTLVPQSPAIEDEAWTDGVSSAPIVSDADVQTARGNQPIGTEETPAIERRRSHDLTIREKLAWTTGLAIGLALLLALFKFLLS